MEHDAVAVIRQVVHDGPHPLDHVRQVVDAVERRLPSVTLGHARREQLRRRRQHLDAAPVGIAELVAVDHLATARRGSRARPWKSMSAIQAAYPSAARLAHLAHRFRRNVSTSSERRPNGSLAASSDIRRIVPCKPV